MKKIKLMLIWICLKISTNLVFKVKWELTEKEINIEFELRDWCKNAI